MQMYPINRASDASNAAGIVSVWAPVMQTPWTTVALEIERVLY